MKRGKLAIGVVLLSAAAFAGAWRTYEGNPVLGNKELGTCFDVNVVQDGPAPYTMYFSWRPKQSIAMVRSNDGFNWTKEPEICLECDKTSGWEDGLNRSCTVKKDGIWHMWYTGQVYPKDGKPGWSRIGYATSTDGVHFTRVRKTPVMVPDAECEKTSIMNPYVRWDAKRGVWRMWYAGGEQYEPNVLCYAESKDGLEWKKHPANPIFGKGDRLDWDRDRVGACEVHPLPDGRYVMFYIGYSDIDTARIGCAFSDDGITGWRRSTSNPLVAPDLGTWNACACYKPSVVREEAKNRWLLWYNGRSGHAEYIGMSVHDGLDLEAPSTAPNAPDAVARGAAYIRNFNANDDELYKNAFPNEAAEKFVLEQCPRFACSDKEIERTYWFRWWTFRKHLRRSDSGKWVLSEFLPNVGWAGKGNTISCPLIHHLREGRWLRDAQYLDDFIAFMMEEGSVNGPRAYACAPAWGALERERVTGSTALANSLLERFVRNYETWEKGWTIRSLSLKSVKNERKYEGVQVKAGFRAERGLFDFCGDHEGSEFALSYDGARPMVNSMMWGEATAIAEIARRKGDAALADRFAKKAAALERLIKEKLWNRELEFFTTLSVEGELDDVRELHGYAPFYFGMPLAGFGAAWKGLMDEKGFLAPKGLVFPRRDTPGFDVKIDVNKHECLWNGPSWPYATSVALTALYRTLQGGLDAPVSRADFPLLLWQYAEQHRITRNDGSVVPWIDENLHPFTGEWIARKVMIEWDKSGFRKMAYRERGKDYNHSTFCDLVISGLAGFIPGGADGFAVDPLAPASWDYFVLDNLRYRNHNVTVRWQRGDGLVVMVDGREVARRATMGRLELRIGN